MLGGTVPEPLNEDDATALSSVRATTSVDPKDCTVPEEHIIDVLENLVSEDEAKIDSILSRIPDAQVLSLVTQASKGLVQTRLRGLEGNLLRTEARALLFRIAKSVGSEIVRKLAETQDPCAREVHETPGGVVTLQSPRRSPLTPTRSPTRSTAINSAWYMPISPMFNAETPVRPVPARLASAATPPGLQLERRAVVPVTPIQMSFVPPQAHVRALAPAISAQDLGTPPPGFRLVPWKQVISMRSPRPAARAMLSSPRPAAVQLGSPRPMARQQSLVTLASQWPGSTPAPPAPPSPPQRMVGMAPRLAVPKPVWFQQPWPGPARGFL